jgi:hypothetical protein
MKFIGLNGAIWFNRGVRKTSIDVNARTAEQPRIERPARKQHLVKS